MLKKLLLTVMALSTFFAVSACGRSPKEVCFNEQTVNLATSLAAEQHAQKVMSDAAVGDFLTGGLLSLYVSANKKEIVNNIKKAIQITDRVSASEAGKNAYRCKMIISIPKNLRNPNPDNMFQYMLIYRTEIEKGEKDEYINVILQEMTPMN